MDAALARYLADREELGDRNGPLKGLAGFVTGILQMRLGSSGEAKTKLVDLQGTVK